MKRKLLNIKTGKHQDLIEITRQVESAMSDMNISDGLIQLFVQHTTCGLTINENADPDVVHDLLYRLNSLAPWDIPQDRHAEGNSAAHLKSSLLGCSLTLPVGNGKLILGTWQGIYLGEFDGPRTRKIIISVLDDSKKLET